VIVCICRSVSDRDIREARDCGAVTLVAIGEATGAGTCCGCCRGSIARILAEPVAAAPSGARPALQATGAVPVRAAAGKRDTP